MEQYYLYNLWWINFNKIKNNKKIYRNIKLIKLYLNLNNLIHNN